MEVWPLGGQWGGCGAQTGTGGMCGADMKWPRGRREVPRKHGLASRAARHDLSLCETPSARADLNQGVFVETLRQQHLHNRLEWLQVCASAKSCVHGWWANWPLVGQRWPAMASDGQRSDEA